MNKCFKKFRVNNFRKKYMLIIKLDDLKIIIFFVNVYLI